MTHGRAKGSRQNVEARASNGHIEPKTRGGGVSLPLSLSSLRCVTIVGHRSAIASTLGCSRKREPPVAANVTQIFLEKYGPEDRSDDVYLTLRLIASGISESMEIIYVFRKNTHCVHLLLDAVLDLSWKSSEL